jgi:hypothetical protein
VIDKLVRDALAQNPDLPGLWIEVWDTADDLIDAAMTLPLSAPATGGYSTTNTIILARTRRLSSASQCVYHALAPAARAVGFPIPIPYPSIRNSQIGPHRRLAGVRWPAVDGPL